MVFNSLTFVVFFALVLLMHALPLPWKTRKVNLLLASYLFYSAWNPPFVILLWVSTVVDWYAAQGLVKAKSERSRHAWMLLSVFVNIGMRSSRSQRTPPGNTERSPSSATQKPRASRCTTNVPTRP